MIWLADFLHKKTNNIIKKHKTQTQTLFLTMLFFFANTCQNKTVRFRNHPSFVYRENSGSENIWKLLSKTYLVESFLSTTEDYFQKAVQSSYSVEREPVSVYFRKKELYWRLCLNKFFVFQKFTRMKAVVCALYNLLKRNSISEIFEKFTNTFDKFCEKFVFSSVATWRLVSLKLCSTGASNRSFYSIFNKRFDH